jgi:hypothetical protein
MALEHRFVSLYLSSNRTYHWNWYMSNTTGFISWAEPGYFSGAHEFNLLSFVWLIVWLSVLFLSTIPCLFPFFPVAIVLSFPLFSCGYCFVFSPFFLWLLFCLFPFFPVAIVLSVLLFSCGYCFVFSPFFPWLLFCLFSFWSRWTIAITWRPSSVVCRL